MKYDKYIFNKKEWMEYISLFIGINAIISYLFYDSLIAFLIFLLFFPIFIRIVKKICMDKRIKDLKVQFIQMISLMATSLKAGFSVENSLKETKKDIEKMYESKSMIGVEIDNMISQINMGRRLEDVMIDFSDRTNVMEIKDFAIVFSIAKRSGGKFSEVIERCSGMMLSTLETERQIQILISGKKYEQKVMTVIPFILIASLRYTSPDFVKALYHNGFGILIMTICLMIFLLSIYLSEKISNIKC